MVDLHWLIHQGAVLEFADGRMETAKKPLPKPVKPEKKIVAEQPAAAGEAPVIAELAPAAEATVEPVAEAAASAAPVTAAPAEVSAPAPEATGSTETNPARKTGGSLRRRCQSPVE